MSDYEYRHIQNVQHRKLHICAVQRLAYDAVHHISILFTIYQRRVSFLYMEIRDITKEAVLISEDATFRDAIALMMKKQTNSLLVVGEGGALVGEVNVPDLLDAIVPTNLDGDHVMKRLGTEELFEIAVKDASEKEVRDFMNTDFQSVHVDDSLITIAGIAIAHQTAHIPIVDHDDRPIGVISRRGLKHILAKYLGIKDSK